eukprot:TRINITY_DN6196_c0_g1_i1.p1 TRINITY_DN6196_c0_g1~~TRINITY_DN6196_c0_g1_i1.p1  ORF type:complete len:259 (-),score=33.46 TRINITY_DN6196_c0_g1_i1:128-904(-)
MALFALDTVTRGIAFGVGAAAAFVGGLYIWGKPPRTPDERDARGTIIRRSVSIVLTSTLSFFASGLSLAEMGIVLSGPSLVGALSSLGLVVVLFLGPLVERVIDWDSSEDIPALDRFTWRMLLASISEEFVFRGLLIPVSVRSGASVTTAIATSMICFALAHVHHLMVHPWRKVAGQVVVTSVFGLLSSLLFVRTGNLLAPTLAHIFCNWMGPPNPDFDHQHRIPIGISYVLGLIAFLALFSVATDPITHGSHLYTLS